MGLVNQSSVYDVPNNLLAVLGSFWNEIYQGREQVGSMTRARAVLEQQAMFQTLENIAALSRFTVPIWHRDNWYPLRLLESDRNSETTAPARYDTGQLYDSGLFYNVPLNGPGYAFTAPGDLDRADVVVNRVVGPSLTLFQGTDFTLTDGILTFRIDPFADSRVPIVPVYTDGEITDREAVLWVYRGYFDWQHIYKQFGYAIGLHMASSLGYRNLLNAVFDCLVLGSPKASIIAAISAITGIPTVGEATETVEDIAADNNHRLIITDKNVYRFSRTATATVAVGDVVTRGQSLVDALEIISVRHGEVPDTLRRLAIGPGMLATCFYSDLIFENREVPLVVDTEDPSGFTKVTWALGGFPADVDRFFDEMHARGVAIASQPADLCATDPYITHKGDGCTTETTHTRTGTLAHLLDRRTNRVGEPTAANLPRTINPLKFLAQNVLRGNVTIVRLRPQDANADRLGLQHLRLLQKIVPPRQALIIILEFTVPTDTISAADVTDTLTSFDGMAPLTDTINANLVYETPSLRSVSGTYI